MSQGDEVMRAIGSGDAEALRELLRREPAAAGARGPGGESPLLAALYQGRRDLAELLLAHGREPDGFEAAALGDVDRLRAAVDADPSFTRRMTDDGWTALHYAAFFGHLQALRLLLARGADSRLVSANAMRNTALHAGLAGPLPPEGARLLVDAGADVNAPQAGGFRPLHTAASRGDMETIDLLLARGADPAAPADDGRVAADLARERGHTDAAARLAVPALPA